VKCRSIAHYPVRIASVSDHIPK